MIRLHKIVDLYGQNESSATIDDEAVYSEDIHHLFASIVNKIKHIFTNNYQLLIWRFL